MRSIATKRENPPPLPVMLPGNNHICLFPSRTFLVVFLHLLDPTMQLRAVTTFLWEWVCPAFQPFTPKFIADR